MRRRPSSEEDMVVRPRRYAAERARAGGAALGALMVALLVVSACDSADDPTQETSERSSSKAATKADKDESTGKNLISPDESGQIPCVIDGGGGKTITIGKADIVTPDWWDKATDKHVSKEEWAGQPSRYQDAYIELKTAAGTDTRADGIPDLLGWTLSGLAKSTDTARHDSDLDDTDLYEAAGCVSGAAALTEQAESTKGHYDQATMACNAGRSYGEAGHSEHAKKWAHYTLTVPGDEDTVDVKSGDCE